MLLISNIFQNGNWKHTCELCGRIIESPGKRLVHSCPHENSKKVRGPGDFLHLAILRWVGESPTRKCGCEGRIVEMNVWGPAVCRERLDKIVGWMESEAKKRGWWQYAVAVPGSRYFIKRMVLGAIKKAEANQKVSSSDPSQQLPISSAGTVKPSDNPSLIPHPLGPAYHMPSGPHDRI